MSGEEHHGNSLGDMSKGISPDRPPQLNRTITGAKTGVSSEHCSEDDGGHGRRASTRLQFVAHLTSGTLSSDSGSVTADDRSLDSEELGGAAVLIDTLRRKKAQTDNGWFLVHDGDCGFLPQHTAVGDPSVVLEATAPGIPRRNEGSEMTLASIDLIGSAKPATLAPEKESIEHWLSTTGSQYFGNGDGRLSYIGHIFSETSRLLATQVEEEEMASQYPAVLDLDLSLDQLPV